MAVERTLSIVKPDGVQKNLIGEVYRRFEQGGLQIIAAKMLHLTRDQAEGFYAVHKERPFFADLVAYTQTLPPANQDSIAEAERTPVPLPVESQGDIGPITLATLAILLLLNMLGALLLIPAMLCIFKPKFAMPAYTVPRESGL